MKRIIPLSILIVFFLGFFLISYKKESGNYLDKSVAKKEIADLKPIKPAKQTKSNQAVYLKNNKIKSVFKNKKVIPFKTKGIITARYLDPDIPSDKKNELFLEYWADKETIRSLRLKEPLFKEDVIELSIQTYTWPKTGINYSIDNFQLFDKPYKTKSGAYAYFSRFIPPAAIIAPKNKDVFVVVTASNAKILIRAINSLDL